jgi:hypothetical protein
MQERKPRTRGPVVLLLTLLVLIAPIPAAAQTTRDALIEGGPTPDLVMFYTGDVIGYLGPCG